MQTIMDRMLVADREIEQLEVLLKDREQRLAAIQKMLEELNNSIDLVGKAEQTLAYVSSKTLGQSVTTIDKLVTVGLRLVFNDLKFDFKTEVEKYRGKTSIKFLLLENGKPAPILTSYGGGPLVLCGVLLRVTTIVILGLKRVLLLDESLSHVSVDYIPNASQLLKKLCSELGFNILMVTHQSGFAEHADVHYEAKNRHGSTSFQLVKKP